MFSKDSLNQPVQTYFNCKAGFRPILLQLWELQTQLNTIKLQTD